MQALDYTLQHYLRRLIDTLTPDEKKQLKNVRCCGMDVNRNLGGAHVFVLSNGSSAKFAGLMHCKNTFCCPVCSAVKMEEYRSEIASAMDALRDEYFCFMMTFTVPHLRYMSCRETTDILCETWKWFRQTNLCDDGKSWHIYKAFKAEVGVKHFVKVMEYTWGNNGWHPHYHCVFWIPRGNEGKVLSWQKRLNDFWTKLARNRTISYWKKHDLHGETDKDKEELLEGLYKYTSDEYPALRISEDKGKLFECTSSHYLAGWGTDNELTGNVQKKASTEGHYTPYQILDKAAHEHNNEMAKLYIDFCLSVTKKPVRHRVNFSKTGLRDIVKAWREKYGYTSRGKKKPEEEKPMEVVAFFDEKQWYAICLKEVLYRVPVRGNILYLAVHDKRLMEEYIFSLGLPPLTYDNDDLKYKFYVEEVLKIYNSQALKTA